MKVTKPGKSNNKPFKAVTFGTPKEYLPVYAKLDKIGASRPPFMPGRG